MPIEKFEISGNSYQETSENMPSLKFPSEIKTCKDNITIVKSNKNIYNKTATNFNNKNINNFEKKKTIANANLGYSIYTNTTNNVRCKAYFNLLKNQEVTISFNNNFIITYLFLSDIDGIIIERKTNIATSYTIKVEENRVLCLVFSKKDSTIFTDDEAELLKNSIQIENGTVATEHVEHKEENFTIHVQQEMLEGDYFDLEAQEEVHTWKKCVFNGTENLSINSNEKLFVYILSNVSEHGVFESANTVPNMLSNFYVASTFNKLYSGSIDYGVSHGSTKADRICIRNKDYQTVAEFKQLLKEKYEEGNPIHIYYKLAEPKRLKLTQQQIQELEQLQKTRTYKNETIFYSTDEVSPIMNLEYKKDLETTIENTVKNLLSTTTIETVESIAEITEEKEVL